MSEQKNRLLPVIFLAIICGFVAGITGEIITRVYILKDFSVPYFNNEVELADFDYNRASLVIRDAKKVVVNQDVKVDETITSLRPALVGIFKNVGIEDVLASSSPVSLNTTSTPTYYKLDEPIMVGLAVTADGWVAVSLPASLEEDFKPSEYVAITSDRKIYKIDKLSDFKELPGDLLFMHLEGASNLQVRKIVPRSEISLGQSILVINDYNNVFLSSLSSFKKSPAILSSDELNARFELAGELGDDFRNSFAFDLGGNLVAIIGSDKEMIPAFSFTYYWQSFFQKGDTSQPILGVNYLDLSVTKVVGINLEKGAWLQEVVSGSPAQTAGLRTGDIITWVNNQELNSSNDLADIVSSFNPGNNITLTYFREGSEKTIEVKLAGQK